MAGASPEGDCWFFHDALKFGSFDPSKPEKFYNTIFLEVGTNMVNGNKAMKYRMERGPLTYRQADINNLPVKNHPRGGRQVWKPPFRSWFERYRWLTVMTGPSPDKITDYKQIHGSFSGSTYWDLYPWQEKKMVALVPVMVPSKTDRYLWVDLTYPLRGIYIPKMHVALPQYKHMCRYSRLKFTARNEVTLKTDTKVGHLEIKPDRTWGWGVRAEWTARINTFDLAVVLTLPERMIKEEYRDPYASVMLFPSSTVVLKKDGREKKDDREDENMNPGNVIDLADLLSKQEGIPLQYATNEHDPHWFIKTIAGIAAVGAGCIPVIGPLLSVSIALTTDALTEPEKFADKYKLVGEEGSNVADALMNFSREASHLLMKSKRV